MKLLRMLPFLEEEELEELVQKIINKEFDNEKINPVCIIPFLNEEQVARLFNSSLKGEISINPEKFLPFVSEKDLEEVLRKIEANEIDTISADSLLPFLNSDQIKKLFQDILNDLKPQDK
ncbi:MAG: hypothetical protein KJ971_07005 [Firmicutes bacterium]|nr:hypothetical protein [Bacillota bacterium]